MRVLFLDDAVFADLPGGSRMVAQELARSLVKAGHEVSFLVPHHRADTPDEEWVENVQILRYHGAGKAFQFVRQGREACARLWAKGAFDIVHVHFAYAALGPLQSVPASVPRVRTFHGPWDEEGWSEDSAGFSRSIPRRLLARLKKFLRFQIEAANLRRCDKVITLSDFFRQQVIQRFGIPEGRVVKIPGGVDLVRFVPTADPQAVRRMLGLPEGRRILLSIRRLTPRMGLDHLIEAMPQVLAHCPDALLLIGGKGPEQAHLARLIARHGLQDSVSLLGFIAQEQLTSYYQAADLFVLPTVILEGFGLVTVESLASGTPVIGTPAGATPEILHPLEPRLLTQNAEPKALAATILSFLQDDWAKTLTPTRLHGFAQERYSWNKHVNQTLALYQTLLQNAQSQPQ